MQAVLSQLAPSSDTRLLARAGQLRSAEDQARALKVALSSGSPELLSYVGSQGLSPEAYKQVDSTLDLTSFSSYDRDLLKIAWQVWSCKHSGDCGLAMASFLPCVQQGYCSANLASWPERHLYSADSSYGYAADMNARGFSASLREQRWRHLVGLVEQVARQAQ